MAETAMHKHMRNHLPGFIHRTFRVKHIQVVFVFTHDAYGSKEQDDIDDDEMLYSFGYLNHELLAEFFV